MGKTLHGVQEGPGDLLREELAARGMSQTDLAWIMGRRVNVVNEIINGKRGISARTAKELEAALGISAEFWLRFQDRCRLRKLKGAA